MIHVTVTGDADLRDSVIALAKDTQIEIDISDEQGFDGLQAIQLVLEYGPPTVALVTSIVELLGSAAHLRKDWSVTVGNGKKNKRKR